MMLCDVRLDHSMHRSAITGGRSAARAPMAEVLRVTFRGSAVGGREHVVVVEAGEPGERCRLLVDGETVRVTSWPRCRTAIVRRIFRAARAA
jgi:hypothetical protein